MHPMQLEWFLAKYQNTSFNQIVITIPLTKLKDVKQRIYWTFLIWKNPSHYSQTRSKTSFSLKTLNSSSEPFSENLQRTRVPELCFIIYQPFGSHCKHHFITVKHQSTIVPLSFSHGSSNLELNRAS
jgi:hypothetical protein